MKTDLFSRIESHLGCCGNRNGRSEKLLAEAVEELKAYAGGKQIQVRPKNLPGYECEWIDLNDNSECNRRWEFRIKL